MESEFYLQTHSTNPLLTGETLQRAIRTFFDSYPSHDSLFGVTRVQTRFWDTHGRAVNHDPDTLLRTQDLPPLFEENSCIYIFRGRDAQGGAQPDRQAALSVRDRSAGGG